MLRVLLSSVCRPRVAGAQVFRVCVFSSSAEAPRKNRTAPQTGQKPKQPKKPTASQPKKKLAKLKFPASNKPSVREEIDFTVAIVGRPNVGKSALFNRLTGTRAALVHDTPNLTRDWREGRARLGPLVFRVIDTAGLDVIGSSALRRTQVPKRKRSQSELRQHVSESIQQDEITSLLNRSMVDQTIAALNESDVALLVLDIRVGVTPLDRAASAWLQTRNIPIVLVLNKAEGIETNDEMQMAYDEACSELNLGEPVCVSAVHNEGFSELYWALHPFKHARLLYSNVPSERVTASTNDEKEADQHQGTGGGDDNDDADTAEDGNVGDSAEAVSADPLQTAALNESQINSLPITLAVVGRPNVGKSTLLNRLLDRSRFLAAAIPGVTRDSIEVEWDWQGRTIRLVDTAGLRRKVNSSGGIIERLSAMDTKRTIDRAHVVALMLDLGDNEGALKQDFSIADQVLREGRALVLAVNKWDLVDERDRRQTERRLKEQLSETLHQARGAATVFMSAATGLHVDKLMPAVAATFARWNKRISTSRLNRWLAQTAVRYKLPMAPGGHFLKLRYLTQVAIRPPTFTLFYSKLPEVPQHYQRFLVNQLRDEFDLEGVPIRLYTRRHERIKSVRDAQRALRLGKRARAGGATHTRSNSDPARLPAVVPVRLSRTRRMKLALLKNRRRLQERARENHLRLAARQTRSTKPAEDAVKRKKRRERTTARRRSKYATQPAEQKSE
eukprot:gnl/Spiro4/14872_TR8015_c0_g3_i2.p1 gnl/Spiro4/14872_TR8015_c0_g3~~gnl/Spiro4/14872_TR8015_c0_g3_i2.p1  ORF type:complete len:730 (+),score=195.51 gnl/Spiro4/14872_TR8015_c0_g3_i2:58-2247(+)